MSSTGRKTLDHVHGRLEWSGDVTIYTSCNIVLSVQCKVIMHTLVGRQASQAAVKINNSKIRKKDCRSLSRNQKLFSI